MIWANIEDLMKAKRLISEYGYDVSDLQCYVTPSDAANIVSYIVQKGAQFPNWAQTAGQNGSIGTIAGINIIESNSVTASYALVVVPKICGTWKELYPLSTTSVEEPYKGIKLRTVELGVTQLTDPKAVCLITTTQKP